AIADIDRDGRNEILVAGSDSGWSGHEAFLYAYDLGGGPHGAIEWGQQGGGPRHQGLYRQGDVQPPAPREAGGTGPAQLIRDTLTGAGGSEPSWPRVSGGRLYYRARSAEAGRELWRTDGTPPGTQL